MDLKAWTQARISALYESEDAGEAFEATFSPTADINIDEESVDRDKYKEDIFALKSGTSRGAKVEWGDCASSDSQVSRLHMNPLFAYTLIIFGPDRGRDREWHIHSHKVDGFPNPGCACTEHQRYNLHCDVSGNCTPSDVVY